MGKGMEKPFIKTGSKTLVKKKEINYFISEIQNLVHCNSFTEESNASKDL